MLAEPIREQIGQLRLANYTIDQIVEHLKSMHGADISRAAMGRHIKDFDATIAEIRRTREVAIMMRRELGDAPDSDQANLNIEIMHASLFDTSMRLRQAEEGASPKDIKELCESIDRLASASKKNVEYIRAVEARAAERAKQAAAKTAETAAIQAGLSAERAAQIRRDILGLKPQT